MAKRVPPVVKSIFVCDDVVAVIEEVLQRPGNRLEQLFILHLLGRVRARLVLQEFESVLQQATETIL